MGSSLGFSSTKPDLMNWTWS